MAKNNVGKKPISQEEYTTNKVLAVFSVCLLGVLVLMILERLLGYSNTWKTGVLVTRVLLGVGIVGAAAGIIMLGQEHAGKRSSVRRIVCGRNMLIASIVAIVFLTAINYYGTMPIKAMYVVLPVLAVYYLVYHSYAPEFFLIAVDTGVGVAAMLVIHRALVSANHTWMSTVAAAGTAVLALIQIAVTASLRRKKGKVPSCVHHCQAKIDTQFSKNAYLMLTITPIVMVALTAVVVLAASHVMIALGAAAAYLFITAVYYTVKLM